MMIKSIVVLSMASCFATAFSSSGNVPSASSSSKTTTSLGSYLDNLDGPNGAAAPKRASYGFAGATYNTPKPQQPVAVQEAAAAEPAYFSSSTPIAPPAAISAPPAAATTAESESTTTFPFGPASYFGMEHLVSKGPRTSDWGTPADASRKLCDDGEFRAGAWYCSEGGWPSPNPKAHTEIFYVLEGYGSLDDADGVRHYFGPGDNVIIPKGHTGRWDVNQPIRKVWAVNDHPNIEERSTPIRVQVDHYNSWAPQCLADVTPGSYDPLYGQMMSTSNTIAKAKTFYDVGPNQVGVWSSETGSYVVECGKRAWIYVLEGVVFITNGVDGSARRCVAGDTIVLPAGWSGNVDVMETTKQLWTVAL